MSGDGYLSGGIAAGLPVAASLCLALAAREASDCFLSLLFACKAPAPSRGPHCLASARFSTPRPRLLASARICARNLVSSLSLKPHVDFLGVRQEGFFLEGMAAEAVFPLALAARHFSPRSRTLGCVVFLLAPRAPMRKGAHSENERHARRDAGDKRGGPKRGRPTQSDPE